MQCNAMHISAAYWLLDMHLLRACHITLNHTWKNRNGTFIHVPISCHCNHCSHCAAVKHTHHQRRDLLASVSWALALLRRFCCGHKDAASDSNGPNDAKAISAEARRWVSRTFRAADCRTAMASATCLSMTPVKRHWPATATATVDWFETATTAMYNWDWPLGRPSYLSSKRDTTISIAIDYHELTFWLFSGHAIDLTHVMVWLLVW